MKVVLVALGVLNISTGLLPPIDVLSYLNFAAATFCFIIAAVIE